MKGSLRAFLATDHLHHLASGLGWASERWKGRSPSETNKVPQCQCVPDATAAELPDLEDWP